MVTETAGVSLLREETMGDITDLRVLWFKFGLFVFLGLVAVAGALALFPSLQLAALMAAAIWAFCRAYYFAFYVIEHYVDPTYRFSGLISFARYAMSRRYGKENTSTRLSPP